ncbi:hypothetical protein [Candidatus Ferrigenium straubiae]|jgi:hypothetical protein|uniref:hypothetical protein n=1 Tax=Candidatus Ferrigenium straubiae TaxID=2919506 RepID=UPI003F4A9736
MSRYFTHFLIMVLLLAGAMAGFNWKVDPYVIYRDRDALLQQPSPVRVMNERVFKTVGLAHARADIVMLGTSRIDIGIGRGQRAFEGKRVFSLATFGQPIRESRRLMEIAVEQSKPKTIVLGLDFFAFNTLFVLPSDYVEENYSQWRPYSLMLSVSTLADSLAVVRQKVPAAGDCCYADGFRTPQVLSGFAGSYRNRFAANERAYLLEKYLPYPACSFSLERKDGGTSLDDLREMIRLAHRHHVDLRLFISPAHARQWETLAISGLWGQWEEWKRQLVRINEDEAGKAAEAVFLLWDFSGYDAISSEDVPAAGDSKTVMRWYSDSAHYTQELGKRIVQRMFAPTAEQSDGWGLAMNGANIEAHLEQVRLAREQYRAAHRQEIADIEGIAREVSRIKHCPRRQ